VVKRGRNKEKSMSMEKKEKICEKIYENERRKKEKKKRKEKRGGSN
jgi:hypothetical protein